MNDHADEVARAAARERMLDVDLHVALGASGAGSRVTRTTSKQRRHATVPWFAAAIALLGLTVTVWIAWQQSQPRVTAQDPAAPLAVMPPCFWITKAQDIANAPAASQNVAVYTEAIGDYEQLLAFRDVRRLMILGPGLPNPSNTTLLPLGKLRKLEELEIPVSADMLPEHLRGLATLSKVRSLRLHCGREISQEDVRALKLMPELRVLILNGGELDVAAVRSLSELPHLDELNIQSVAGCTEEVLGQLRGLHRLRQLTLSSIGEQPLATQLGQQVAPGAGLTPAVAQALGDLPLLEQLRLVACRVSTAALAALPTDLQGVTLVSCPDVVSSDLLALKKCQNLTQLGLDKHSVAEWHRGFPQELLAQPEDTAAAQAELIRELPLREFDYTNAMPTAVRLAVAAKQGLTRVTLRGYERGDLETVATLANLEHLTLNDGSGLELAHLGVLTQCKSLKTLTVMQRGWATAELQLLLPGVKVIATWL